LLLVFPWSLFSSLLSPPLLLLIAFSRLLAITDWFILFPSFLRREFLIFLSIPRSYSFTPLELTPLKILSSPCFSFLNFFFFPSIFLNFCCRVLFTSASYSLFCYEITQFFTLINNYFFSIIYAIRSNSRHF